MSVTFNDQPEFYYYEKDDLPNAPYLQDGLDRRRNEQTSINHRDQDTLLETAMEMFRLCREKDITIVFGNLGRHPLMLNYFLDYVFSAQESVGVLASWESPYHVQDPLPTLDVLCMVEPYFGAVITKPPNVKHLIVLTSHLNLQHSQCAALYHFHVGCPPESIPISKKLVAQNIFTPPAYHEGLANQLPNASHIHIDVTRAKSSHEAYLRLLTAKELISAKGIHRSTYTIGLSPKQEQHLSFQIGFTRKRIKELGWNKAWIQNGYCQEFKNSGTVLLKRQ